MNGMNMIMFTKIQPRVKCFPDILLCPFYNILLQFFQWPLFVIFVFILCVSICFLITTILKYSLKFLDSHKMLLQHLLDLNRKRCPQLFPCFLYFVLCLCSTHAMWFLLPQGSFLCISAYYFIIHTKALLSLLLLLLVLLVVAAPPPLLCFAYCKDLYWDLVNLDFPPGIFSSRIYWFSFVNLTQTFWLILLNQIACVFVKSWRKTNVIFL